MATTGSLKMQKPDAHPRIAWCSPPAGANAADTWPSAISSAACTDAPVDNSAASYMPG